MSSIETTQLSAEVEHLRTEITDLKSLVRSLSQRRQLPRRRTPSPAPPTTATGLCWYHARFAGTTLVLLIRQQNAIVELVELGKRESRSLMATSVPGSSHSRLFFVRERSSHYHFLIDTGAEVSVIPSLKSDRQHCQCGVSLQATNGVPIPTLVHGP